MVSISKFYNNVKSFILQSFESKSEEDYNLPNQVESLFVYNNGKEYVKETTIPTPVAGESGGQSLYDNLVDLINQNFFKRNEKTNQYKEWLKVYYSNGNWYVGENFLYYNDGSDINLHNPQNAIITTNNGVLTITTNSSGEKKVNFPTEWFNPTDNCYMEMTYCGGSTQPIAICFNRPNNTTFGWVSYDPSNNRFSNSLGSSGVNVSGTIKLGDVFRLSRENGVSKFYQNNTLLFQATRSFTDTFRLGFYTNNGRVQMWKDIKIKKI